MYCVIFVVRMSESLYKVKQLGQNSEELTCVFDLEPVCRPRTIQQAVHSGKSTKPPHQVSSSGTESEDMTLSHHSIFVDSDISDELRLKVTSLFVFNRLHNIFAFESR